MASFVDRIVGAAKLNVNIYEEVEADKGATGQAFGVVILASIANGIGAGLGASMEAGAAGGMVAVVVMSILYTILALLGWFVWAFVTYIVGTKILPEPETSSNMGELLRTTGFAQAPGILRVAAAIPVLGYVVTLAVWVWMLVAFVIAVRQALDYKSTIRAVAVCAIGWIVNLVIVVVVGGILVLMVAAMIGIAGGAQNGG